MECTCIKIIYTLLMSTVIEAFNLQCPENLQRIIRGKYVCSFYVSPKDRYSCLFDQDSNFYRESCKGKLDYVRPGQKYVVSGRRRNTNCSSLKYQPFKFWSNKLSRCVFEKSKCSGIGQIVFSNGSSMSDSTCRCDYTRGYAFVMEPRDKCFCLPTEEDCMCYIVDCPRKMQLNQDYMCSSKDNSSTFRCPQIIRSEVESKASTIKDIDEIITKNIWLKLRVTVVTVVTVVTILGMLVWIVILCKYNMFTKEIMMTEANNVRQINKISPEKAVEKMRIIYEHVEKLLSNKDFDKDFQEELSAACPNYMNVFLTSKRDLLRNDCGIVIAGETSAGKTTLLNHLVETNVFVTSNLAATGTVCRIRNSELMSIKIYTKDEQLIAEETADDLNELKHLIKKYTDVERNPPEMVDVYLPVPILKGNVIFVDTPGIGESDTLTNILLDFLPHAVSFVFIINARNAGGVQEDRLLRILKTVINKGKEMPCFDPKEEVMFLTNQWDIIDNIKEDGDEEDQHAKTLNKIIIKLEEYWPGFCTDQLYQISLKEVNQETFFAKEFDRFLRNLNKTIERNKNKHVKYYFRFIQKFAINAEMGIASRLHLLKISEDDREKAISKTQETVEKLATISHEKMMKAKGYKTEVIAKLAEKLSSYLHSDTGRNEILNPRFKHRINSVPKVYFNEEVFKRINMGISRWCEGTDVDLIIQETESKVKTLLSCVESIIYTLEEDITGKVLSGVSCIVFPRSALRMNLMSNGIETNEFVKRLLDQPAVDYNRLATEKRAHEMYQESLSTFKYEHIRTCFENNFGTEYDRVVSRIFDDEISLKIKCLKLIIEKLRIDVSDSKMKTRSLKKLGGLVNKIKTEIDDLKAI